MPVTSHSRVKPPTPLASNERTATLRRHQVSGSFTPLRLLRSSSGTVPLPRGPMRPEARVGSTARRRGAGRRGQRARLGTREASIDCCSDRVLRSIPLGGGCASREAHARCDLACSLTRRRGTFCVPAQTRTNSHDSTTNTHSRTRTQQSQTWCCNQTVRRTQQHGRRGRRLEQQPFGSPPLLLIRRSALCVLFS